ncbi:MAG: hypothetical protein ACI9FR_000936 [Cryomorphaceae bacterium]|jgi:hypothetical protein
MNTRHRALLALACVILLTELAAVTIHADAVTAWLSDNWWLVIVPFAKTLIKRALAMELAILIKAAVVLLWNLYKLFMLKTFNTLSVRYGIFFSQNRWYWIRQAKVMFVHRGRQFFRTSKRFWNGFSRQYKWIIMLAFFPVVLLLALLGLSFNATRKPWFKKLKKPRFSKWLLLQATQARALERG